MKYRKNPLPRVVAIGGGTGLSTMLRGLKKKAIDLTAIVTVADNGGGSGMLRQELGMLPPGDVRNCIQALANAEPTLTALLGYRFTEGSLKGQSLGNLFLAALNDMYENFDEAVDALSKSLAITGRVLPVTNENVQLCAEFTDGAVIIGECEIADYKKGSDERIRRLWLSPEKPVAVEACLRAIADADLILLGPGSLYTSVLPNLLVEGIPEAIHASGAMKLYIMNLMTQDGETEAYDAADHVRALFDHGGDGLFSHVLVNDLPIPEEILPSYAAEGAYPISVSEEEMLRLGVKLSYAPVARWEKGLVRHDPDALSDAIMDLYYAEGPDHVWGKGQ